MVEAPLGVSSCLNQTHLLKQCLYFGRDGSKFLIDGSEGLVLDIPRFDMFIGVAFFLFTEREFV
jgi:hypothetical protein